MRMWCAVKFGYKKAPRLRGSVNLLILLQSVFWHSTYPPALPRIAKLRADLPVMAIEDIGHLIY